MALGDPYISAADLKTVLGITDTSEDALVNRAVNAATRAINGKVAYSTFWNTGTPVTRTVDVEGRIVPKRGADPYFKLLLDDGISSATGFAVAGQTKYTLLPSDAIVRGRPATAIRLNWGCITGGTLDITAIWGWPSVPDDIVMACQMQATRFYKRRGSPEGIAGSAEWGVMRIPFLDPDVKAILEGNGYMSVGIG